jgi:hypothetical protein
MTPERLAEIKQEVIDSREEGFEYWLIRAEHARELIAEIERLQAIISNAQRSCNLYRSERETVGPCGLQDCR